MKTLLLLTSLMFVFTSTIAQVASGEDTKSIPGPIGHYSDNLDDRSTPFWTEDFGGGFPAGWAVIDSSNICPWRYSHDGSWGYFSTSGISSGDAGISSTTGANGFLICDNDSANHFTYGQPSSTNYQYLASYFGTSAIDCSGHSSVILRFEQSYRYNNTVPMFVKVSTDSVNWTSFNVSGGLANNTASMNPDVEILNLSTIASNQATVYLQFGWSARVYFWMIDDISMSEADPNDILMGSGYWGTGVDQNQYYKIPMSQLSPITFNGPLTNNTGVNINSVYFDVDVNNGSSVFSGTSNLLSLPATETDTAVSTTNWTPSTVGSYTITYDANIVGLTDGNLANNTVTKNLEITSSIYGLDNLPADGTGYNGGISNWSGNTGQSFGIGNLYEIISNDEAECVQIGITTAAANEGGLIYGAIYYYDGSSWTGLGQTSDYTITNADLGKVVSIPFTSPVPVTAGQEILVVACHYGGADVQFMMAQSVPNQMVYGFDAGGSWYYLGSPKAIVARANFSCSLGMDELNSSYQINCYPNPAADIVNVEISLTENTDVTLSVIDINGNIVISENRQQLTAGNHVLNLSTDKLAAGIYTVKIKLNDQIEFKKITVQ